MLTCCIILITGPSAQTRLALTAASTNSVSSKKIKEKKHLNLSLHLVNYSANPELNKASLTLKAIQTFINVAESDNAAIISNCVIALSNISSHPHVRSLLFEINAVHKFTSIIQHVKGPQASWASALLFYYFSCDKETEDRVYSTCSSLLQSNGASKDPELRLVTLYTLNNLMPCIDRQRVAETTMRIINAQFDTSNLTSTYLLILQNLAAFSNAHSTLLSLDIISLLRQAATMAAKDKNLGIITARNLINFVMLIIFLIIRCGTQHREDNALVAASPRASIQFGDQGICGGDHNSLEHR